MILESAPGVLGDLDVGWKDQNIVLATLRSWQQGITVPKYMRRQDYPRALLLALLFSVGWWLVGLRVQANSGATLFSDQLDVFLPVGKLVADPYQVHDFVNVPWTVFFLVPFAWMPPQLAILVQAVLYFMLLATLVFKFKGGLWAVGITFASALAFDAVIELNLEWIVVIGLLVPRTWSGPFLAVKPQVALGAWFGFEWRELALAILVTLVVVGVSLLVWPGWPQAMWANIQANTLGGRGVNVNISFVKGLTPWISFPIGTVLAFFSFRRKDVLLGIIAWQFFVPYATFYGYLFILALVAARWWWVALLFTIVFWIPYSQVLLAYFF
ncbi:hypothetical protein ACFLYO_05820 [Chloroflexota bacterium]